MRILIVEDEKLAAERLSELVLRMEPEATVEKKLDSVRNTVKWLENNPFPDLIFMDVQLADGVCFEIFEKINVEVPVIFTTAYNEYALRAFKVNSIDYLLKPIDEMELRMALQKFHKLNTAARNPIQPQLIKQVMELIRNPYKSRFVVKIADHIKTVDVCDISFFYSCEKSSFLRSISGRDYAIEYSLDQLENELDPQKFFRVSRKHFVAMQHITDIIAYSGNRLKVLVTGGSSEEILVSREKVTEFKNWLNK